MENELVSVAFVVDISVIDYCVRTRSAAEWQPRYTAVAVDERRIVKQSPRTRLCTLRKTQAWVLLCCVVAPGKVTRNVGNPTVALLKLLVNISAAQFMSVVMRRRFWNSEDPYDLSSQQEAQLMLTTGSTRLAVSRGQQTWYHSTCYI